MTDSTTSEPARRSWYDPERIKREADQERGELVEIRHEIHRRPELGFEEHITQALVEKRLRVHGYDPRPCATTGLVADLVGDHPGPMIALRADLDCLPMDESTPLPYRSLHPGRAHKCGHDGHTAILLGAAILLAKHRASLHGKVRFLFQPAEEGVRGGGAKVMVREGALEGVAEVYGLHNWPPFPLGELRVRSGTVMAAIDTFEIEIRGRGGHGSQPQHCRDPIVAASHLVCALQTVVSRGLGSDGGAVVTVGSFHAGVASNIIPDTATLVGTIRSFSSDTRERVLDRVREIVTGIGQTFGVQMNLVIDNGYPTLVNDATCAAAVERVAAQVLGPERTSAVGLPIAGGEDFAYFTEARPGAYFFMGAGDPPGDTPGCHHPDFDFDDRLIAPGIEMFVGLVHDRLSALAKD